MDLLCLVRSAYSLRPACLKMGLVASRQITLIRRYAKSFRRCSCMQRRVRSMLRHAL